mgnify:CR=1 FL=1
MPLGSMMLWLIFIAAASVSAAAPIPRAEAPNIILLTDPSDNSDNPKVSTGLLQAQEMLGKYPVTSKFSLKPREVFNSIGEVGHKGK